MAVTDSYELTDRYRLDEGRVFLSGSQALARLPYEQLRADRRAGLTTAAYVTGYPGSPLGNYDRDVAAAARLAADDGFQLVAQPAMNEELAATAVMGSQLTGSVASRRVDGVVGIWYGKGPGLDRASDAIRHGIYAGTDPHGGALALVGDDPSAKSSTIPSSSGLVLAALSMPFVVPGDVQEAVDLGRHAIAMSRACGMWVGVRVVDSVADGTGSIELHPDRIHPIVPTMEVGGVTWVPRPTGRILTPDSLGMEREFHEVRLPLAVQYGTLNRLNEIAVRGRADWIGVVAAGQVFHETREALHALGFRTDDELRAAGIRVLRIGMPFPLDPQLVREFADGLTEIVVVEEKAPQIELSVKDALYGRTLAPAVLGKADTDGTALIPVAGALDADLVADRLRRRLQLRLGDRMTPAPPTPRQLIPLSVTRTPYFCSGCPHNTSTKVPDGALVAAGIGCHSMVLMMEPERVGDILGLTSMGNEGAQWFGISPFVDDDHLIQNLGDGTLFHSGMTAVRSAIASGTNITYKLLLNGAVAMTGGQDAVGALDVQALVNVLLAQGVAQVLITTDDTRKYLGIDLPKEVKVWGRSRVIEAQEALARVPGCTVLIHDQRCAAEKRRDRKRGRIATPKFRVEIDERVCEGCGDCGDQSNCLSVQPVETPFGRKTRIDQSSCNLDLSCLQGDCPAFRTVKRTATRTTAGKRAAFELPGDLPDAPAHPADDLIVRLSGIGGTGVVTVSQILGTAAMLDGLHVRGMDQTGLSQKAGPVVSDLRLSRDAPHASNRARAGSVDVLLAFDQLVAGADATIRTLAGDRTTVVVNTAAVPTGSMVTHPDRPFPTGEVTGRLDTATLERIPVDATRRVLDLFGDDSAVNVFVLGVAAQRGLLPVSAATLRRAIELNGVSVDKNLAAFEWGRDWAINPATTPEPTSADEHGTALRERLSADLVAYQSARYAARFATVVDRVAAAGHPELTDAVARNLHKLMAYKDEYEVARLLLAGPRKGVRWMLHPPMLRAMGVRSKLEIGRTAVPAFSVLRAGRRLRGTPFDVFGLGPVRKVERAMVPEYIAAVDELLTHLQDGNVDEAVAIASLPDRVRGYEQLKLDRAAAYRAELRQRLDAFVSR